MKLYQNFTYFAPFWAPKGATPLFEQSTSPKHVSYLVWLKLV